MSEREAWDLQDEYMAWRGRQGMEPYFFQVESLFRMIEIAEEFGGPLQLDLIPGVYDA